MINNRMPPTLGTVLDYHPFESESTTQVRVKGFHSPGRNMTKEPGFVYLVPNAGGARKEDELPAELRDISVARFWQLVDEGRLEIYSTPQAGD